MLQIVLFHSTDRFDELHHAVDSYYVVVVEDTCTGHVVAASLMLVVDQFFQRCNRLAQIFELAVAKQYRGRYLGQL